MKRLHALDTLRGLAALSVVVWHWQHFYALNGTWQPGWQRQAQPFFWALKPLYEAGWAAVDLFFALSGFVFFWLYGDAIARKAVGAGRFALLRFSRLYPLHFATLVAVAALQALFHARTGQYFIFESGDWPRFAAGLVMAQQWLPPTEDQFFNGPAWSVSIEVLLYIVFFLFCRLGLLRVGWQVLVAALGAAVLTQNEFIGRGLIGFFLGGAVWFATEQLKQRRDAVRIARLAVGLALAAWAVVVAEDYFGFLHAGAYWLAGHLSPAVGQFYIGESDYVFLLPFIVVVSPLTLAALALSEQVLKWNFRPLAFLGDISYSTYLWHFPLQLVCAMAALRLGLSPAFFMHPLAMIAFFAALIAIGALSFHRFETPLQNWLRGGVRRRVAAPTPTAN